MTDWVHLVQAEYLEMPGLQLTRAQVRRLWGLEDQTCDAVSGAASGDALSAARPASLSASPGLWPSLVRNGSRTDGRRT